MALIVEDGSGMTTSESFASVSDADTYHSNRGNSAWTGSDSVKEIALRKATDFMEGRYGLRWRGRKHLRLQALSWPRDMAYDSDGYYVQTATIPAVVKNACAELAMRALTAVLNPDDATPCIASESNSLPGPLSASVTYIGSKSAAPIYSAVDAMLRTLLIRGDVAERS